MIRTNYVVKIKYNELKIFDGKGKLLRTVPGVHDRAAAKEYLKCMVENPVLTRARDWPYTRPDMPYIVYSPNE